MEIPGLCSICGQEAKPALSCILCGSLVCAKHYLPEKNICKKCSFKS